MTAGKYTIVAQVIDGMDVLDKMEKIKVGKLLLLRSLLRGSVHDKHGNVAQHARCCVTQPPTEEQYASLQATCKPEQDMQRFHSQHHVMLTALAT